MTTLINKGLVVRKSNPAKYVFIFDISNEKFTFLEYFSDSQSVNMFTF